MSFQEHEKSHIEKNVKRQLTPTESQILAAEWSEHCSYKSSKQHLRMLPTTGPNVIVEKGYDSGVLDVGDGYVVTVHTESHNHPSAVEPFGGAATGVGGVIRDILSAGTRPIALFDGLRFGNIEKLEDLHQYVKKLYLKSSVLIYKKDKKENYLIVCKNQTCSNKIKNIEELKIVKKNYAT